MPDKVEMKVGGVRLDDFLGYTLEADLYEGGDAFSLDLAHPSAPVQKGMRCEVYVNDELELTGIIDRVTKSHDKRGVKMQVSGRDLMGLVVDSYVEEFVDLQDITLGDLARTVLKTVPYINRKTIQFADGRAPRAADEDEEKVMKANPGDTKFELLRRFAAARGLLFYSLPNGQFIFGKPLEKGKPEFELVCRKDGLGNNTIEGEYTEDISQQFSKIIVIGQQDGAGEGDDAVDVDDINIEATVANAGFPFYKPFVMTMDNAADSAARLAKMTLEQQRAQGTILSYTVPGHTQGGKNWAINRMCRVEDEVAEVSGVYLIYGRTFERSRSGGDVTRLRLGLPGVIQ